MSLKRLSVILLTMVLVNCENDQRNNQSDVHGNKLCQIEKELMSLKVLLANQDTTIARQDVRIAEMSLNNHKLHTEVSSLKEQLLNQQQGFEVQKDRLLKLQQTLDFQNGTAAAHREGKSKRMIAFSVHATTDYDSSKRGDVLPFDAVELNIGDGFDKNVFTCPVTGLYFLQWSCFTNPTKQGDVRLRVNGNDYRFTANHPRGNSALWITSSNGIVIHLTYGDRVWLETTGSNSFFRALASFHGFLI